MASIESILKMVVEKPGQTAAELADKADIPANDLQSRLAPYIKEGKVTTGQRVVEGERPLISYFPAQSLVDDVSGGKPLTKRARQTAGTEAPPVDDFTFGFFSNGGLSIAKGTKEIKLGRDEASRLIAFLDAINVDQISASA